MAISTHLPPPVMMESTEVRKWVTHMLCWTCAMYFSAAASSENDQGSMNLASKTASVPSTIPSRVAAIQGIAECLTRRCTSRTCWPVLRSYQDRLSSSVALPSCTIRLPDGSAGAAPPVSPRHRRTRAPSSLPMMMRVSEPPMKLRRSKHFRDIGAVLKGSVMTPSNSSRCAVLLEYSELRQPHHSEDPRTVCSNVCALRESAERGRRRTQSRNNAAPRTHCRGDRRVNLGLPGCQLGRRPVQCAPTADLWTLSTLRETLARQLPYY